MLLVNLCNLVSCKSLKKKSTNSYEIQILHALKLPKCECYLYPQVGEAAAEVHSSLGSRAVFLPQLRPGNTQEEACPCLTDMTGRRGSHD